MKKIIYVMITVLFAILLSGCNKASDTPTTVSSTEQPTTSAAVSPTPEKTISEPIPLNSSGDSIQFLQKWSIQTKLIGDIIVLTCTKDGIVYEAQGVAQGMINRMYLDGHSIFVGILGDSLEDDDTLPLEYALIRLDFVDYDSVETTVKNRDEIFILVTEGLPQVDDIGVFNSDGSRIQDASLVSSQYQRQNEIFTDALAKQDALTYGVLWVPLVQDGLDIPLLHIERVGLNTLTYVEQACVLDVNLADEEVFLVALAARPDPMMAVVPNAPMQLQFSIQPKRVVVYAAQNLNWPNYQFDTKPSKIELNEMSFRVPNEMCWMGYIIEAEFEDMVVRYKMVISVFSK